MKHVKLFEAWKSEKVLEYRTENKYIEMENDELVGPIPFFDEEAVEKYLLSVVDPKRVNDIKKFMSDDKNGWGKALRLYSPLRKEDDIDKITPEKVEQFATTMASWYLESEADAFPYKEGVKKPEKPAPKPTNVSGKKSWLDWFKK